MNRGRNRRLRRLRGSRGQALVEMVILLPVFLLLVFGVIEFGRVFNYWIDLTHLANEGARYASVNRWPTCPGQSASDGACNPTTLKTYLVDRANTGELRAALNASDGVQICYPEGGLPLPQPGSPVRVIVTARIKMPVLDGLIDLLGASNVLKMRAASTMRLEWPPDRLNETGEGMIPTCP